MTRKIFTLILLIAITSCSYAQTQKKWRGNFLLNGSIENTVIHELKLSYTANTKQGIITDTLTLPVVDGKFSLSNYIEEPLFVTLSNNNSDSIHFFLDPTIIDLHIKKDFNDFTIEGSPTSDEYLEIEELRKGFISKNENQLNSLIKKKNDFAPCETESGDYLQVITEISKLESQADLAALTFASKGNNSFAVLKAMSDFLDPSNKYYKKEVCAQMLHIYKTMPEYTKDTPTGIIVSGGLLKAKLNMKF